MNLLFQRVARVFLVLALLPTMVLGTAGLDAILIHNHQGQDLHLHTITINDSKAYSDSWSCEHEAQRPAAQAPQEGCNPIVLELGLPDALLTARGLSSDMASRTRLAPWPVPPAATLDLAATSTSIYQNPWSVALHPGVGSVVAGILLTNHALLL